MVAPAATNGNDKNIHFLPLTKRQLITGIAVATMAAVAVTLIGPLTIASLAVAYPVYAIGAAVGLSLLIGVAIYKSRSNKSSKSSPTAATPSAQQCSTVLYGKYLVDVMRDNFNFDYTSRRVDDNQLKEMTVFNFKTATHKYVFREKSRTREASGWHQTPLSLSDSTAPERYTPFVGDIAAVFTQAQVVHFKNDKNLLSNDVILCQLNRNQSQTGDLNLSLYHAAVAKEASSAEENLVSEDRVAASSNLLLVKRFLKTLGKSFKIEYPNEDARYSLCGEMRVEGLYIDSFETPGTQFAYRDGNWLNFDKDEEAWVELANDPFYSLVMATKVSIVNGANPKSDDFKQFVYTRIENKG